MRTCNVVDLGVFRGDWAVCSVDDLGVFRCEW